MSHESSLSEWPSGQLQAVPLCPVCHSAARTLLHEGLTDRVFYCAPGRWTLYRCSDCGSAYLDPRPSPASIGLAYARYYTHDEGGIQFSDLSPWCTRFPAWREGYLQQRFPAYRSQGPASAWGGRVLAQIGSARALLERDVRHLPTPGPAARLVDIGCGSGHFVRIAASLGYQAEGLEFDQQAVAAAQAQGIAVAQGALPDTWLDSAAFEAVTLSQVIEHLHDPLAALRDIARILKPGGFFWLATPNGQAHGLKRFGPHWRGLEPPRHLAVLSPTALTRALAACGFRDIRFHPVGPVTRWFYQASLKAVAGLPHDAPLSLNSQDQHEAASIDRRARRDPKQGEELVVTAIRSC